MPHACSKVPDHKPYPTTQPKTFPSAIPFILYQGADDDSLLKAPGLSLHLVEGTNLCRIALGTTIHRADYV